MLPIHCKQNLHCELCFSAKINILWLDLRQFALINGQGNDFYHVHMGLEHWPKISIEIYENRFSQPISMADGGRLNRCLTV